MDLVTLEEYKAYKQLTNPSKDEILQGLISSVSNLIKVYCGRTFIDYYDTPRTEVHTITKGVNAVILNETPVRIVSGVTSDGLDITTNITVDSYMGIVYSNKDFFTEGPETFSITYTGGYAETPPDIKLACFELVDYYSQSEHKAKKTFGGTTIEYHQDSGGWPHHIQSILNMYRDL